MKVNMESGINAEIKPVLLISASDSSGAAGMAVDIRAANDLGYPVRCAVTAVTIQGEKGLVSVLSVEPDNVACAIAAADSDPPGIAAVKIGLITEPEVARAISTALLPLADSGIPVILDPVMRSTPGSFLTTSDVKEALFHHLLPVTTVITPNRDELDELAYINGSTVCSEEKKAAALIAMGTGAVLVTGGDDGGSVCADILYTDGDEPHIFEHPRIGEGATRGTGCTLSTAIAVRMGEGLDHVEAIDSSIAYITGKIEKAKMVGNQRLLFPGKQSPE